MPQLRCYVPDAVADKLKAKAQQSHLSISKYLAAIVSREVEDDWPENYFELFGTWQVSRYSALLRVTIKHEEAAIDGAAGYKRVRQA